jgi:periplasmic copper chaperone A
VNFGHAALYHGDRNLKASLSDQMKRRFFLAALLMPTLAFAHFSKLGEILIGHSWALPSTGTEAQIMMPLINNGSTADALVAVSSSIATNIELRNGTEAVNEFKLDPHKPFPMRAAAYHIHLMGLTKPLLQGDTFPLKLKFKAAGEIEIQIHVAEKPGE